MTLAPVAAGNGVELPHAVEEDLGAHESMSEFFQIRTPWKWFIVEYELTFG